MEQQHVGVKEYMFVPSHEKCAHPTHILALGVGFTLALSVYHEIATL